VFFCCESRAKSDYDNKALHDRLDAEMTWGAVSHLQFRDPDELVSVAFKVGIFTSNRVIVLRGKPPKLSAPVEVYLENTHGKPYWSDSKSKIIAFFFLPPDDEKIAVEMKDAKDVPVPKTAKGASLTSPKLRGKKWRQDLRKDGRKILGLLPYQDEQISLLDPAEYFAIDKPGLYKLELVQHLYVIGNDGLLEPISLPPITINVRVENLISQDHSTEMPAPIMRN
jgi:hypothetical protein